MPKLERKPTVWMSQQSEISRAEINLLREYRDYGDQAILGELFNRHIHLVYGLCLKYLKDRAASQDAVMDIYEHICEKLLGTEVSHFKSWLYMVSKNHCLMALRKSNREEASEIFMEFPDATHLKEEKISLEENLTALEECIDELKEDQKICVQQFFIEKRSYQEVERSTGMELKKVKSHIQNGKRNLRNCLEGKNVGQ